MATTPSQQYLKIQQQYPDLFAALENVGIAAKQAGPIDAKHAQLIQLAAAAAGRSEGAVHSHAKRALEAGASKAEIYHSLLLLTSTIGFPAVMAAISWAEDELEQ